MARIVFTLEDGTEIETELDAEVITIGRHADSIVVLPSSSVSSHHATIRQRGDSYYVQDLGTTNGTRLNGVEVEEARLEDGDQLTFGDIPAVVHLSVAPITRGVPTAPVPIPVPLAATAPVASKYATSRSVPIAPGPRRSSRPVQQYEESSGCAGFLTFLLFLVLAFAVGLHVRHGVETGGFLIGDVIKKVRDKASDGVEKDAAPAPKEEGKAPAPTPAPAPAPAPDASAPAKPAPAAPSMMNGDAPMSNMAPAMNGEGAMSEMAPKPAAPPAAPAMMEMN
ncbi:FHA domain-containing protein [Verrucomicrobium sp. BvORR106]|uniref:FHA domain-containing protein n=1 Tax=Verrucomicrobium sp. BvORR106 TaxID=1403819 RepID=UPI00068C33CF|nr:FHA domain-containing protein [Verrucomicrobium sp. BvORR106]